MNDLPLDLSDDDESGSTGGGGMQAPPALMLPFPFEVERGASDEEAVMTDGFWHDGSYRHVDWWSPTVRWGKWVYDARTRTIKHALTRRLFSFQNLDSPERLLRAMASLMIQPHGDSERFYQLASGLLQKRHGVGWESFWGNCEAVLSSEPTPRPSAPSASKGAVR
jgi:hypothetical protein